MEARRLACLRASVCVGMIVALVLLTAAGAFAAIPKKMAYQGRLTDGVTGEPRPGSHNLFFSLHNASSGGIMLWSESKTETADSNGVFSTILGSVNPIHISFADPKWLSITVDGEPLSPRREIVSVAGAFNAQNADSLGGLASSSYSLESHTHYYLNAADGNPTAALYVNNDGEVGIGTTLPQFQLDVRADATGSGCRAIYGLATPTWDEPDVFGVVGETQSSSSSLRCAGVHGLASSTAGSGKGVYGYSVAEMGTGVYGWAAHTSGKNYGVIGISSSPDGYGGYFRGGRNYFEGKVGIGTDQAARLLHVCDGGSGGTAAAGALVVLEDPSVATLNFLTGGTGSQGLLFGDPGRSDQGWIRYSHAADKMTFGTGFVERMAIANDHKVGFGTLTPESNIHIEENTNSLVGIKIKNTDTGSNSSEGVIFSDESGDQAGIVTYDDGSSYSRAMRLFNSRTSGTIRLETGGLERMRISNTGFVGIGTTNPPYILSIHRGGGELSYLQLTNGTTGGTIDDGLRIGLNGSGEAFIWNEENTKIQFATGGSSRVTLASDGKLGIGTSSPTATLDVYNSTGYGQVRMRTTFTPTSTTDTHGNTGDITWDNNYIYIKTAAGWKRAALASFGL